METYSSADEKADEILRVLNDSELPHWTTLRRFCVSQHGLVSDRIRVRAWPLLLGLTATSDAYSTAHVVSTRFEQQIQVDIARSLRNFDLLKTITQEERQYRAAQLTRIMTQVLGEDQQLHYFQGFHDICTVFLLVAEEMLGLRLIHRFVYTHCRDSMRPAFDQVSSWMRVIPLIIKAQDNLLGSKIEKLQEDIPMFALSWVITFFAHSVPKFHAVARIYDFCLGTHPLGVLYLVAAVILLSREAVMVMTDLSDLHRHFAEEVKRVDWDAACEKADRLMQVVPPRHLATLRNRHSARSH